MSNYLSASLGLFVFAVIGPTVESSANEFEVKVLTFNLRYGTANDGENSWPQRKGMVIDVIAAQRADFCGVQEALEFQLREITETLPQYAQCGVGRDDGKNAGEFSAILYLKQRWRFLRGETHWLSDTPNVAGSRSWGNTIPRIVTWAQFADRRTGDQISVFNTHFDHRSQESRLESANYLSALINTEAGQTPLVLTGDFNAGETNPAIGRLLSGPIKLVDTFRVRHADAKNVGTFNGFRGETEGEKIDYIFSRASTKVRSAEIIRDHINSRYPSDHFPVSAELTFGDT